MSSQDVLLIDADSHISEPPDLWESRVSRKWDREEIPHVRDNRWWLRGVCLGGVAQTAAAGWVEYPPSHPPSIQDADPAAFYAPERLKRLDEYGIRAQVLYPNLIAFSTPEFIRTGPELSVELVRAYNDFQVEFASADPRRLIPIAMVPFWDMEAALAELGRAVDLGCRGLLLASHPEKAGLPPLWDPYWEPLLAAAADRELSVNFHIGFGVMDTTDLRERQEGDPRGRVAGSSPLALNNARAISEVICHGICHRFPGLKIVSVESGVGWLPFLMESLDWHWKSFGAAAARRDMELPSYYFRRQVFGTFWFEEASARDALERLPENVMFETDFPHPTSLSPGPASAAGRPMEVFKRATEGLPPHIVANAAYRTAERVYGL